MPLLLFKPIDCFPALLRYRRECQNGVCFVRAYRFCTLLGRLKVLIGIQNIDRLYFIFQISAPFPFYVCMFLHL
jgi:hypothetical protein